LGLQHGGGIIRHLCCTRTIRSGSRYCFLPPLCWRPNATNLGGSGAEPLSSQLPAQPSLCVQVQAARRAGGRPPLTRKAGGAAVAVTSRISTMENAAPAR
jgi:hypothetical protein